MLVLIGHAGPVYSLSFSSDNLYLVSGSQDGYARVWDLSTGLSVLAFYHEAPVWNVAFGPIGYNVLTACRNGFASLWTPALTGAAYRHFREHGSDVEVVIFHPNMVYAITGSFDAIVRVFDIETGYVSCVKDC